jgi:hypothetical protein
MSQARSGSYLYPRVPRVRKALPWAWLLGAFFLACVATHALAFTIGHVFGYEKGALQPPRIVTRTVTPLTQWECSAHERREYIEACKRRAQSALIAPKE